MIFKLHSFQYAGKEIILLECLAAVAFPLSQPFKIIRDH